MFRLSERQFKTIYDSHFNYACNFVYPYLGNREAVEEIVQTSFVKLYSSLNRFQSRSNMRTYFTRILLNTIYDSFKKKKNQIALESIDDLTIECEINSDQNLEHTFEELTLQQLSCIQLYYYDSYAVSEIADILNVSAGTVKTQLSRSRAKIKAHLVKENLNG